MVEQRMQWIFRMAGERYAGFIQDQAVIISTSNRFTLQIIYRITLMPKRILIVCLFCVNIINRDDDT